MRAKRSSRSRLIERAHSDACRRPSLQIGHAVHAGSDALHNKTLQTLVIVPRFQPEQIGIDPRRLTVVDLMSTVHKTRLLTKQMQQDVQNIRCSEIVWVNQGQLISHIQERDRCGIIEVLRYHSSFKPSRYGAAKRNFDAWQTPDASVGTPPSAGLIQTPASPAVTDGAFQDHASTAGLCSASTRQSDPDWVSGPR